MWSWMCNPWKTRMYMFGFAVASLGGTAVVNVARGPWLGGNIGRGIGPHLDRKSRLAAGMNRRRGSSSSVTPSMRKGAYSVAPGGGVKNSYSVRGVVNTQQ